MNVLPEPTEKHRWAVYVCGGNKGGSPVKIGISSNPSKRRESIQTCWPGRVEMHYTFWVPKKRLCLLCERACKDVLKAYRIHGEMYGVHAREAALVIKNCLGRLGAVVDWLPDDVHSDNLGPLKYKNKSAWERTYVW